MRLEVFRRFFFSPVDNSIRRMHHHAQNSPVEVTLRDAPRLTLVRGPAGSWSCSYSFRGWGLSLTCSTLPEKGGQESRHVVTPSRRLLNAVRLLGPIHGHQISIRTTTTPNLQLTYMKPAYCVSIFVERRKEKDGAKFGAA